jgi:uncharacterized membrane protein
MQNQTGSSESEIPWTLSSDRVWEITHKIGSKLFKVTGIVDIAGVFF